MSDVGANPKMLGVRAIPRLAGPGPVNYPLIGAISPSGAAWGTPLSTMEIGNIELTATVPQLSIGNWTLAAASQTTGNLTLDYNSTNYMTFYYAGGIEVGVPSGFTSETSFRVDVANSQTGLIVHDTATAVGTASSPLVVQRGAGTANAFQKGANLLLTDGSGNGFVLQYSGSQFELWQVAGTGTQTFYINSSGGMVYNAPAAAVTPLTLKTGSTNLGDGLDILTSVARGSGSCYLQFLDPTGSKGSLGYGSGSNDKFFLYQGLNASMDVYTNGQLTATFPPAGGLIIETPATAGTVALIVNGTPNNNSMTIQASSTASESFGLQLLAGTNSTDFCLLLNDETGAHTYFKVRGDGLVGVSGAPSSTTIGGNSVQLTSNGVIPLSLKTTTARGSGSNFFLFEDPTGLKGYMGYDSSGSDQFTILNELNAVMNFGTNGTVYGTISAAGQWTLYEGVFNSAKLDAATYNSGSFTGTLTGCTTAPTATINWVRVGNMATLYCSAGLTATSNSTSCSITGTIPTEVTPAALTYCTCVLEDDSITPSIGVADINSGTIILSIGINSALGGTRTLFSATGFTNAGAKGLPAGWSITYPLQ